MDSIPPPRYTEVGTALITVRSRRTQLKYTAPVQPQTWTLIIIIIINDNVYGAVLVTMVAARVHPVHFNQSINQ